MGALPILYAATYPEIQSGAYYGLDGRKELKGYPTKVESNEISNDKSVAMKLWEMSEKLTGIEYRFHPDA
jgi:hypothetical protein